MIAYLVPPKGQLVCNGREVPVLAAILRNLGKAPVIIHLLIMN